MRNAKGFTLIELIIVIALIGILSAIALPNFGNWLNGHRLKNAAFAIRGDLHRARVFAAKNKHQYRVVFGTDGYEVQQGDKRSGSTAWAPDTVARSFADYPGVSIKSITANPVFNPRGTVTDAVTITLENNSGSENA